MIEFSPGLDVTNEDHDLILNSLPLEWTTEVISYSPDKNKELHIKINAKTISDTKKWLDSFQKLTNMFYSVNSAYNSKGQRVYYKKRYHCHHNTRHKNTYSANANIRSIKNTKCPSNLIISIRKIINKYQGKNRPADPKKPCEIKIKLNHNHELNTPDIKKFKKVLPEVKQDLLDSFANGCNASTALKQLKEAIKFTNEDYIDIFNDRSRCPDYSYCYYLYLKYQEKLKNSCNYDENILSEMCHRYNTETNDISAEMAVCENGIVVCLCPPLAKRVHQTSDSSKIVFVDSFASLDNNGNRIFLFLAPSQIGCVPLGVLITSNECPIMTRIGLSLLKEMLGDYSSNGQTQEPSIFITDEFLAQEGLLTSIWPKSKNYLSIFHVLQNVWHFLSNSKNSIASEDKPLLFKDFYNVLYAKTEAEFNIAFSLAQKSAGKYESYYTFLQKYFEKKEFWALYSRPDILKEDNDTIKYSESTIRFLRINMFKENKNFEFSSMIKFIIEKYYPYFERRLLYISSSTIPDVFFSKKKQFPADIVKKIQVLGPNMRLVPSQSNSGTYYIINIDLLTCTCAHANSSSICKHVQCVSMILYQKIFEENCQKEEIKNSCRYLATGDNMPEDPLKIYEAFIQPNEDIGDNIEDTIEHNMEDNIKDNMEDYIEHNIEDDNAENKIEDLLENHNIANDYNDDVINENQDNNAEDNRYNIEENYIQNVDNEENNEDAIEEMFENDQNEEILIEIFQDPFENNQTNEEICAKTQEEICANPEEEICANPGEEICANPEEKICANPEEISANPEEEICSNPEEDSCANPEEEICSNPEEESCANPEEEICSNPEEESCANPEEEICANPEEEICANPEEICANPEEEICANPKEEIYANPLEEICANPVEENCANPEEICANPQKEMCTNIQEEIEDNHQEETKEEKIKWCMDMWKNITTVFEGFIDDSSENFAPVIGKISSKFEAINNVSDFKFTFNIFEPVSKRGVKRKLSDEDQVEEEKTQVEEIGKPEERIEIDETFDEENVENIANYIVLMNT